jgi:PAS domain S-box-containing protein
MSIRVKLCLGLVCALLLLVGIGLTSERQMQRSLNDFIWVTHTHDVLLEVERLSAALGRAESNERGYLLIGDEELDAAFHDAQHQVMGRFTLLRALTADNPRQQRRLNYLRPLLTRVLAVLEGAIAERQKNGKEVALVSSLVFGASQQPNRQIERVIEEMRTEEQELREGRVRASHVSSQTTHALIDLGTVLAVILVLLSALVVGRDLKRREEAEIALLEIQQGLETRVRERTVDLSDMAARYRLLFEDSPLPMVVFDVETLYFLAVNAAAHDLYGYTREEFLAMTLRDTQPPGEGPVLMEVLNTIEAADAYKTTFVSQRKDGRLLTIEARVRTIDFAGRRAQLALITDITEQKRLEAQLRQSQKMEAIGRLAGGIAHDFNNLLTVILGYSDLILRKLSDNHPLRVKVSQIQAAGQRAANLTSQLLAFSRKQILNPQILDLNTVVSDISQMLRRLLGEDIEILLHLDPDLGQVRADPTQLEQVLVNLAVNARDAMPHGGQLVIETHNRELDQHSALLAGVPPGRYVVLEASDTGCGMDEATQVRVFEPFFTTKDVGKGTGLGLSTVLGIVQQSGGTVTVYSELGRGTTFKVYLPRLDGSGEGEKTKQAKSVGYTSGGTILLVEDEDGVRTWAAEVLRDAGCAVLEASNGREALQVAEDCPQAPALLLTDVVMPGMGGPELAQNLRDKWPDLPVVYASGYTEHALLGRSVLHQDMPFLQKPYTADALLEQVHTLLG